MGCVVSDRKSDGLTLEEIESALKAGQLWLMRGRGPSSAVMNYWTLRRNGKTQRWKQRWEIPAKAGLRECVTILDELVIVRVGVETWEVRPIVCSPVNPMEFRGLTRHIIMARIKGRE